MKMKMLLQARVIRLEGEKVNAKNRQDTIILYGSVKHHDAAMHHKTQYGCTGRRYPKPCTVRDQRGWRVHHGFETRCRDTESPTKN